MTSCFIYLVIGDLKSLDHLCINPINNQVICRFALAQVRCTRLVFYLAIVNKVGAQWLSGRVLDSRPKGRGFQRHRRHCVVVLEQDALILA